MITASALVVPSVEAMEDANRNPPINFCLNPENIALRETLSRAVVLQDSQGKGAVFIEAHLNRAFHRHGWKWFARAIPGNISHSLSALVSCMSRFHLYIVLLLWDFASHSGHCGLLVYSDKCSCVLHHTADDPRLLHKLGLTVWLNWG